MQTYLSFSFSVTEEDQQEQLIALLADFPFEGFQQEEEALTAFLPQSALDEKLQNFLDQLAPKWPKAQITEIAPTNWNAQWESDYQAVEVDDFCLIRANFHAPVAEHIEHEIVITPKMSFGTGHHATTYMVLQAMRPLDLKGKKVMDFGCGTAVLAIMAAYLGAKDVFAFDFDPWAYENSLENVANNCPQAPLRLAQGGSELLAGESDYDLILANINRNVILSSMSDMVAALKPGGQLICSGFLEEDIPLIIEKGQGLRLLGQKAREKWRCLIFEKG